MAKQRRTWWLIRYRSRRGQWKDLSEFGAPILWPSRRCALKYARNFVSDDAVVVPLTDDELFADE